MVESPEEKQEPDPKTGSFLSILATALRPVEPLQRRLLEILGLVGVLLMLGGFVASFREDVLLACRSIGFLLLLFVLIYVALHHSAQLFDDAAHYLRSGWVASGFASFVGGVMYSLTPAEGDTQLATPYVLEKLGRFVLLSHPIGLGIAMIICAKANIERLPELYPDPGNARRKREEAASFLAIALSLIPIGVSLGISAVLRETHLAIGTKNMGDIDYVVHLGTTIAVLLALLVVLNAAHVRSPRVADRLRTAIGTTVSIGLLVFVLGVLWKLGRPRVLFPDGTGLGVAVATASAAFGGINLAVLAMSLAAPRRAPARQVQQVRSPKR